MHMKSGIAFMLDSVVDGMVNEILIGFVVLLCSLVKSAGAGGPLRCRPMPCDRCQSSLLGTSRKPSPDYQGTNNDLYIHMQHHSTQRRTGNYRTLQ